MQFSLQTNETPKFEKLCSQKTMIQGYFSVHNTKYLHA